MLTGFVLAYLMIGVGVWLGSYINSKMNNVKPLSLFIKQDSPKNTGYAISFIILTVGWFYVLYYVIYEKDKKDEKTEDNKTSTVVS